MSARSFRSVFMVASCAGAALGCYLVSLRVASERPQLEDVESRIVLAQRDMRVLQTEIGTRGRLDQLERWNVRVLALSAPAADQFVSGGYELAKLTRTQPTVDFQAPVVMASAPAPVHTPAPIGQESRDDAGCARPPPRRCEPESPAAPCFTRQASRSRRARSRRKPAGGSSAGRQDVPEKPVAAATPAHEEIGG